MNRTRSIVLLSFALLLTSTIPFMVNEADAGAPIFSASYDIMPEGFDRNQHIPMDMETDPDGRIYLLYEGNPLYYYGAFLTHSDDDGITWSEPIRVDDVMRDGNESNDEIFMEKMVYPRMDIGPDGTVYVVWTDWREYKDDVATTHPVQVRLSISTSGEVFGTSKMVTPPPTDRTQNAGRSDVTVNSDGRVFITWLDKRETGTKANLWSRYTDDDGDSWSPILMINNDGKFDHSIILRNPRCVMDGDNVYITWSDNRDKVYGIKPYFTMSSDGGDTFAVEKPFTDDLVEGNIRDQAYPEVDSEGNLNIVWTDERSDQKEIWFVRSEDQGGNFTSDKRLVDPPIDANDLDPVIRTHDSGRMFATWVRETAFTTTGGNIALETDVHYITSMDDGETWEEFLRVDDEDRYIPDRLNQRYVSGVFTENGRVICAYEKEHRENDGIVRSLFITRHSRTIGSHPSLPTILDIGFMGSSGFDPIVGSDSTNFTFSMVFKDVDNDEPVAGFPRLNIFRDQAGTDPLFTTPVTLEKQRGPTDIYYMDGVPYVVTVTIPEEGQFYWTIDVSDESDPAVVSSPVMDGPLIDLTLPSVEILEPLPEVWNSSDVVRCRILVTDTGGAGVDLGRIRYDASFDGPEKFDKGVLISSYNVLDNDTVEAYANVHMYPGKGNFLRFNVTDRVGNGPFLTEPINMWLDPNPPYFENARPLANDTRIYPDVNCSITIRDNNEGTTNVDFTGVDPTTLRYAFKTTSDDFSDWMVPDGYMELDNGTYRVWATITFPDEGVHSRIKWMASDNVGNIVESRAFIINVDVPDNYKPVFIGRAWPTLVSSPTPHFWWDDAYDEDEDTLFYKVMFLKNNLNWIDWEETGSNTFYDLPDSDALEPGHYVIRIHVTDHIGGEDIMDHHFQIIEGGSPPPSMIPAFGPYYTTDPDMSIDWEESDLPGTEYSIRIGSSFLTGDVLDWTPTYNSTTFDMSSLELPIGTYSVQIIGWGNGNFSRIRNTLFKVGDYKTMIEAPLGHMAYRGKDFAFTGPIIGSIVNNGTFGDNVTLTLVGEPVDAGWVFFESTGDVSAQFITISSKGLEEEIRTSFKIVVSPEEKTPKRDFTFTIRAVSEDGTSVTVVENIVVTVKDAPNRDEASPLAEDITSVLPFLSFLPDAMVIPIFLLLIMIIIGLITVVGIFAYKILAKASKPSNPIAERIKTYKDLYGQSPSEEEIAQWRSELETAQGSVSDEMGVDETPSAEGTEEKVVSAEGEDLSEDGSEVEEGPENDEDDLLDRLFD